MTSIRRGFAGLALALLAVLAAPAAFATTYFVSPAGGAWDDNNTWRQGGPSGPTPPPGTYPGSAAGDTANFTFSNVSVTVGTVIPNAVTLNETSGACSIKVNTGGTLPLSGASVSTGSTLEVNGGTISNGGTIDIQLNSFFTFTSGTLTGSGQMNIATDPSLPAILTIAGGTLDGSTINVNGKAKLTGSWAINNNGVMNISSTGIFDIQSTGSIGSTGGGAINNSGKVDKTAGAGGTNIVPPLNNNNLVKVQVGDLVMNGSHTNGTFDTATGSFIELAGTINGTCSGTGTGGIKIVNTLTIASGATFTVVNIGMAGGTMQGPVAIPESLVIVTGQASFVGGTWTRNLDVDINGGATMSFAGTAAGTISNNCRLRNFGTININAGVASFAINNAAYLNNNTTLNLAGDVTINSDGTNNARIDNESGAAMYKTAGAGLAVLNVMVNNDGDLKTLSGNMKFTKSGTHTNGTFWVCDNCTMDFAGGTHTMDGVTIRYINFNAGAIVKLSGATFDVQSSSQVDANDFVHTAGTITGSGDFAIFANYKWSGGTNSGSGQTQLASFTHLFDGATGTMLIDGRDMNINGTVTYSPTGTNYLTINNGGSLTNGSGYVVTMTTDAPINSDGTGIFNNIGGLVQKTGGSGAARIAAIFNNTTPIIIIGSSRGLQSNGSVGATLNVVSGQVELYGGGTNTGTLLVPNASNAIIIEGNTYHFNSGTTTNPADLGVIRVDGGELMLGAVLSLKNVELLSGTLDGSDLTITNKLKWTGGTILGPGTTTISNTASLSHLSPVLPTYLDNRTLEIFGTADYEGTGLQLKNNSTIENEVGATFNTRDGAILSGSGANAFNNDGTLKKNAGVTGMRFDVPVVNTGTVSSEVNGQSLIFAGGGSQSSGTLTTVGSALIDFFSGTFAVNGGTLAGTGQHRVNGGTLQVNLNIGPPAITLAIMSGSVDIATSMTFQVSSLNFTGGTVNGPGTLRTFGGSIGNISTTTLANGTTLTCAGSAFSYNADTVNHLVINDTSKFNNENGSSLSITADSQITGAGTAAVTNSGTFKKTGGAGYATITVPFTSSLGIIGSTSGTLYLVGGGTISTSIDTGTAAIVAFGSSLFSLNSGASVAGTGTIAVQLGQLDVNTPLTIPNLRFTGGTIAGSSGVTVSTALDVFGLASPPTNLNVALTNNGTFTLQNLSLGGSGSVLNNGTFNRSLADSLSFSPTFTNAGNVNFLAGSLAFNNGYTQTGGTTTINGGTFSTLSPATFTGGVLRGTGAINASITNNGATVQPGFSPGILTINGNYSQSPTGVLNIELGGTAPGTGYDRLVVSGNATLAGTVNVTLINSFTLSGGDVFDVVTYASHSGTFSPENLPPFPGGTFSSMYTPSVYKLLATVPTAGDVGVTKTGPASASTGSFITYTIVVKNLGTSSVANVIVNDPTPIGLSFESNSGDCTNAFPCALGTLAGGAIRTIVATYRVTGTTGTITNTATLSVTDTNNSNNSASTSTSIACPNLTPTNLQPNGAGGTSGTLTWTGHSAQVYEVFLGPKGTGCTTSVGKVTTNAFNYSGLAPNTEYEWRVVASFGSCPAQSSACVTFKTDDCPTLEPPVARVVGEATSQKTYNVEWDAVPGALRYEVEQATDANFSDADTAVVNQGNALSFSHDVTQPKAWYYRVRAIGACNNTPGPYSIPIRVVIVPPPSPTDKNPTFNVPVGSHDLITHKLFIPGQAGQNLFYTAHADREWLFVTPPSGALPPAGVLLDVIINPGELPNGTFTATIIVEINSGTSGGLVTNATTTSSFPVNVNLVTPVTPVSSKNGPSQFSLIVPAVGHLSGIDSAWQSDVRLTNAGFKPYKYKLTFTPAAGIAGGVKTTDVSVDAGATMALDDIVRNWYGFGSLSDGESGMLEITPIEDAQNASLVTVAASRTYNVTSNGTLGQFVPAVPFPSFIGKAAQGGLATILSLQQIAQSNAVRTNVGIVEAQGKTANAIVSIFNATGTKLLDLPQTLAAGQQLQLNGLLAQNNITLSDGRVEVKVSGGDGKVTAYASVVDNGTGDPSLVSGVPLTQAGSAKYVLPGAANINTGFADWRTDMRIFNYGTIPQNATLTLFPLDGSAPRATTVLAKVGEVLALDNIVKTLFNGENLGGAVQITTPQPASFIITGRTFNQSSNGQFGQFINAVTPEQGAANGGRALQILQVEDSPRFRFNVGITELSGKSATVEISVVLPDSKITPVIQVPLGANESKQFNVIRDLNLGNVYNGRISVRVVGGDGRVTAYGSLIDELTGDPTFVSGQ